MCKGLSYVSMLYVLSSPRDKNGQLKNLTKLKNILTRLVAMELPEFKLRQQILNKKIESMLQTVHQKIDQLDDEAIRTELLRMQNENLIDASQLDSVTTPEQARNLYFQKLCDEYKNKHFSTNEKLEESLSEFLDAIELCQLPHEHKELDRFGNSNEEQLSMIMLPLLYPSELETQGGASCIMRTTGVFEEKNDTHEDELETYITCLYQHLEDLSFPVSCILCCNEHAITLHFDPLTNQLILINANVHSEGEQPIVIANNPKEIAQLVRKRFIFSKSEPKPDSLILTTDVFVARIDSETAKTSIDKLKNDETFKKIFAVTPKKTSVRDEANRSWLYCAIKNGDISSVGALHAHGEVELDPKLDMLYAKIQAKIFANASQYFIEDPTQSYSPLDHLIKKTYQEWTNTKKSGENPSSFSSLFLGGSIKCCKFYLDVLNKIDLLTMNGMSVDDQNEHLNTIGFQTYAQSLYQGKLEQNVFEVVRSYFGEILWMPVEDESADTLNNKLDRIYQYDREISAEIRKIMLELQQLGAPTEITDFFDEILVEAARLALETANTNQTVTSGVIVNAFSNTYSRYMHDEVIQQKINDFFEKNTLSHRFNELFSVHDNAEQIKGPAFFRNRKSKPDDTETAQTISNPQNN